MDRRYLSATKPAPIGPDAIIRVGVIGTGFGSSAHIPALQRLPNVEVVAVCSRRPERAHTVAAKYGIRLATGEYRDLLRPGLADAIVVATPPHLHHQMAFAALEAGRHLLVEKPMSRSLGEARDLVKMAELRQVVAMVNHEYRFVGSRRYARELIESGYIGEPQSAAVTVFRSTLNDPHGITWDWLMEDAKGGGMLGAAGSHYLDALRWWFGEVKAICGATATMVTSRRLPESREMGRVDADDNFAALLKFVNGALGTITYSATAAHEAGEQIVLSGSGGMLMLTGEGRIYGMKAGEPMGELAVPERLTEPVPGITHPLAAPTARLVEAWIDGIRAGEVISPTLMDGLKVQELLDGISRSSQLGRWVEVERGRFAV